MFFSNIRICLSVMVSTNEEREERGGRWRARRLRVREVGEKLIQSTCCTIPPAFVLFRASVIRFTEPDKQLMA